MLIVIRPVRRVEITSSIAGSIASLTSSAAGLSAKVDEVPRRLGLADLGRERGQKDQERKQREQGHEGDVTGVGHAAVVDQVHDRLPDDPHAEPIGGSATTRIRCTSAARRCAGRPIRGPPPGAGAGVAPAAAHQPRRGSPRLAVAPDVVAAPSCPLFEFGIRRFGQGHEQPHVLIAAPAVRRADAPALEPAASARCCCPPAR